MQGHKLLVFGLLCLVLESTFASVAVAGQLNPGSAVEKDLAKPEEGNFITQVTRSIVNAIEQVIEKNEKAANLWRDVVVPRSASIAKLISPKSNTSSFFDQPTNKQFDAMRGLADRMTSTKADKLTVSLIDLEWDMSDVDPNEWTQSVLSIMALHIALFVITVMILATTPVFSRPTVRTQSGKRAFLCLKNLPKFVCSKNRMLLFVFIVPALMITSAFACMVALKELTGNLRTLLFLWGAFSFVFSTQMFTRTKIDDLAIRVRKMMARPATRQSEESDDSVIEISGNESLGSYGEVIPEAIADTDSQKKRK